jgi:hypothetical protein
MSHHVGGAEVRVELLRPVGLERAPDLRERDLADRRGACARARVADRQAGALGAAM